MTITTPLDVGTAVPALGAIQELQVVGRPLVHHDFVEKVKGSLAYAADWQLPGMLFSRLVRSQMPSARIRSLSLDAARAVPGVVAVLTARDVPVNRILESASGGLGEAAVPMPVLAADRVRYVGEPVALIGATTQQAADEAAELVEVEYDELPGVYDVEAALAKGAPLVHESGNVLVNWRISCGDLAAGFSAADVVVEGVYESQRVEHAYLEPEAGVAWVDNGVVTLRVATQVIEHSSTIAAVLGLPLNKVRVIATYMGGGFGGKEDMTVEPYVALLAWHTKRPVRMVWDRQESLVASTKRHPFHMRYRTGVRHDGTITAEEVEIVGDAGAYPCLSARVLFAGAACATGPYKVPNASVTARAVFTNQVPTSAFRGFGAMQVTLAYEGQMDLISKRLGIPLADLKAINFLQRGDELPSGEPLETGVFVAETMHRALSAMGDKPLPSAKGRLVGRGFACNRQPYGRTRWFKDRSSAWMTLNSDGSLLIRSGITDLGGGQAASLCQIAAEVLAVPLESISVHIGDSALNPPGGGTYATRQLYMSGNAALKAALELRRQIAPVAADMLGASVEELLFTSGRVSRSSVSFESSEGRPEPGGPAAPAAPEEPERPEGRERPERPEGPEVPERPERPEGPFVTLAELASECASRGVSTTVLSTFEAPSAGFDPVRGQGTTFPDYTYGTHVADVEVDSETGEVRVLRYVACHDVGRAINPLRVEGQVQGGVMQGLGYALTEEVVIAEGVPQSMLFADYLVPTTMDFPDIEVLLMESGEGKGPLGARGIGEPAIGPVAAAIASAVHDAVGLLPQRTPVTPERVLELIDRKEAEKATGADSSADPKGGESK